MSSGVKKIFITLIVVVICVIGGAFVINILFPNTVSVLINSVEDMLFKATGMSFDFNNDGNTGDNSNTYTGDRAGAEDNINGADAVEGFN